MRRVPTRLALIGNGAIAKCLAQFCAQSAGRFEIAGALALPAEKSSVGDHPLAGTLDELFARQPDLIVECAGHEAVRSHAPAVLDAGFDLILVSTGSLADPALWREITAAAERSRAQVKLPAGALPGIDALSAAKLAGLSKVSLKSSKPPKAWAGTPAEKRCDLSALTTSIEFFSGNARDAALAFPKNANVAATVALAGLGFEKTIVTLTADPGLSVNVHHLEAEGTFGRLDLTIEARPSPDNPRTSYIAALSIMRLLSNEAAAIVL